NDGDLDILLTGYNDGGVGISKIYQNTGSGFFEVFAGSLTGVGNSSVAWGDYDNDGDLDILLTGHNSSSGGISKIYQNTGSGFTEVFAGSLTGVGFSSVAWGDYDNDGDLDILLTGSTNSILISKIYQNTGTTFNTPPTATSGLTASISGSKATVSWLKATDAQTPKNGLTYNLRIGTSPNGINTQSPMANVSSGYRRVVKLGNTNHDTTWTVKNLANGTYYWSVQAIDNAFAGSQFASEKTFTVGSVSSITLVSPNGGENWNSGTNQNIIWTSQGIVNVKLEYTTNAGLNWMIIADSTDASAATYSWLIPETGSIESRVRISDLANPAIFDISDEVFSIIDVIPPSAPVNLTAVPVNEQVTLNWDANAETDLMRYRIYGGTAPNPMTKVDSSQKSVISYTHTGLTNGVTYYYRITAVDSAGNESQFSTEVSAVPQGTAPQINITQSSLEFGSITVGSSKDVIIQINNSGDELLQISNIVSDNVVFTPLVASIQIDGGEEENFTIRFTPTAEQEYSANLSYSSNASNYVAVSLSGKGFVYNSIINSLQHTYSFGTADVKDQTNYRLVGFPGVLSLNLADVILDKQNGIDWQAYYDPGSNEYVKYSTSDNRFNLTPGIGYWLICNASIALTKSSVPAVSLNSENSYNIPLHNGWNIISNPFVVNVDWDAVKTKNGTGQSIYYYTNGGYISPPPTLFEPYKGYYFNNSNPQLSELKIPYPASLSKRFLSEMQLKKTNVDSVITLSAKNNGNEIGELEIGFSDDSSDKLDLRDIFAPPLGFTKYYFSLQNDSLETEYKYLAKEFRALLGEGQVYNVLLRSEINSKINMYLSGMHNFDGYEVYLLENRTKNLQLIKEEIEFKVIHTENELQLIIGKSAFIEKIKKEIIPRDYVI
ncbi:MAG: VCBS repeat-containing protein, partial [Bacteroidetes bacterium]|nr:VCBS repeat-containing protein [Bacteroidota bacterium]